MDKELPESALGIKPPKSYIRVSKSNLPGYKGYKASVIFRSTIGIETIAERIVKKRNVYGKETLVTAFNIIKNEIYEAIEEGFNVDFGFGRTEITASGSFESLGEKFNRKKHTLTPCLRPSPQLKAAHGTHPGRKHHAGNVRQCSASGLCQPQDRTSHC